MKNSICLKQQIAGLLWIILLLFQSQFILGQKRLLTEDDYRLWGKLYVESLSDNGEWLAFQMNYDEDPDTLFVQRTDGKKQYKFAGVNTGVFGGEHWFAFHNPDQSLSLLDMASGNVQSIASVESFAFGSDGDYLVSLTSEADKRILEIRDKAGKVTTAIPDVENYKLSPNGLELIYTTAKDGSHTVEWVRSASPAPPVVIMKSHHGGFGGLVWQENAKSFAFIHQPASSDTAVNNVYLYRLKEQELQELTDAMLRKFLPNKRIAEAGMSRLTISPDGRKVFFGVDPVQRVVRYSPDSVQVWNGNDKWTYTERKTYHIWETVPEMAVWSPATGNLLLINDGRPQLFFSGDMRYAFSFNQMEVGPQYEQVPKRINYMTDLDTGKTELWLPEAGPATYNFDISPGGKFLAYFRDGSYWVYDFSSRNHINITDGIHTEWQDVISNTDDLFGIAGWGTGDKALFLHDSHDVYKIDLDTWKPTRLTRGREENCVYRLVRAEANTYRTNFELFARMPIDLETPLPVLSKCHTKSSFVLIYPNGKISTIASGEIRISSVLKAKKKDSYVYRTERFDRPPLLHFSSQGKRPLKLFQSSPFYEQFLWGKSAEIDYTNSSGTELKGVLTYPAGYDPSKKYPMVVYVYEDQFGYFHNYYNPSHYNSTGMNISNLSSKGYFVLRPDIVYKQGEPGTSAVDCTVAAVNAVIAKDIIDPGKIGLIGQSFGGYETNFIITQTDLFSAAVSGAGVGDLQSHYLSIGWYNGQPEIFRFENQQWRMGKSLFEAREAYERNSPVLHAANIKTPLLLWAGELDRQVHYYQSIAFHLALRRLGKEHLMLLYPNEGHALMTPKFQKDLTSRAEDWFDHYLKSEKKEWILEGTK